MKNANKIGAQCQWDDSETLRFNKLVKSRAMMGINVMSREFYEQLKTDNPGVKLIWRHYPDLDWADDPERRARENVAFIKARLSGFSVTISKMLAKSKLVNVASRVMPTAVGVLDLIDYIVDNNEYFFSGDYHLHLLADRYMSAFIVEARKSGLGALVGNISCGHFASETVDTFPLTLQALQDDAVNENPSRLAFHEYDWPTMKGNGDHWLCGKVLRAMPPIVAKYPDVKCAITEFGVDRGVVAGQSHLGWAAVHDDMAQNVALFCGDEGLTWYNDKVLSEEYVDFAIIFGCGMGDDWRGMGFDIANSPVIEFIASLSQENGGNDGPGDRMVTIYDREGNELAGDAAENMVAYHGLSWEMPQGLQPGDHFYNLVALRDKTGSSAFVYCVKDIDGNPIVNPDENLKRNVAHRAWWWPDVQEANDIITPFPTDHHRYADLGGLNKNGEGGSGMGAFHDPNSPGPYQAWVRHPSIPSVILEGIGMVGSTNHDHMDGEWQEEIYENGGTEPVKEFKEVGRSWKPGSKNYIRLFPTNHNLHDMRGDLRCGDWSLPGLIEPVEVDGKVGFEFDCSYVESEDRIYTAEIVFLPETRIVGTFDCDFIAGAKGVWEVSIEWGEGGPSPPPDPTPGPTPEPGEALTLLVEIAEKLERVQEILKEYDSLAERLADLI